MLGAAALAVATMGLAQGADASLSISLQPTSGDPTNVHVNDVLQFNVVATVLAATPDGTANEGVQTVIGSLTSTPGANGPVGNFSAFSPSGAFAATGQTGLVQDLNGLPCLDVGSNDKVAPDNYVAGRAASMQVGASADTATFVLGTVSFTITNAGSGGSTSLQWVPRTDASSNPLSTAAVWRENGGAKTPTSAGTGGYSGQALTVGAVPEPGSLALLGLGGLGLLLRRRRAM